MGDSTSHLQVEGSTKCWLAKWSNRYYRKIDAGKSLTCNEAPWYSTTFVYNVLHRSADRRRFPAQIHFTESRASRDRSYRSKRGACIIQGIVMALFSYPLLDTY